MADATDAPAATATASTAPGGGAASGPAANAPRRVGPRALLVAGLIGLALFAAFGLAVFQDVEAPFTQPLDDAWRRLVGASGLDQVSLGRAHGLPVPRRDPRRRAHDPAHPAWLFVIRRWRSALFFLTAELAGSIGRLAAHEEPRRPPATG